MRECVIPARCVRTALALALAGSSIMAPGPGRQSGQAEGMRLGYVPPVVAPEARHTAPVFSVAAPASSLKRDRAGDPPEPLVALPDSVPVPAGSSLSAAGAPAAASASAGVTIALAPRNIAKLRAIVESAADPRLPSYRHYLSDAAFLRDYAPTQASYRSLAAYLSGKGLTVDAMDDDRLVLQATGTRARLDAAFHTSSVYRMNPQGEGGYVNVTPLQLPASLAAVTAGVSGFDGTQRNRSFLHRSASVAAAPRRDAGVHDPAALRTAYTVPSQYDGTGQTVAVVLWRQPVQSDLDLWNGAYHTYAFSGTITPIAVPSIPDASLPTTCPASPGNVTTVCTMGQAQAGLDPQDDAEANVDAVAVHVVAPGAQILFSLAPGPDDASLQMAFANAIAYHDAGGKHVAAISASWGMPCDSGGNPAHAGYDALFLSAQALGIPVVVASGDSGIFCGDTIGQMARPSGAGPTPAAGQALAAAATATPTASATPVPLPAGYAASPANSWWVLAVGGTSLSMNPTAFTWQGESAWSCVPGHDDTCSSATGGASGGGLSSYQGDGQPSWQQGRIPPPDSKFDQTLVITGYAVLRAVPDISTNADPATGLAYYDDGNVAYAGGTSVAAPWMAGILALAAQKAGTSLGFVTPFFYGQCAAASMTWCNDVTGGYNGESARTGWDYTTGLGSVKDDAALVTDLTHLRIVPTPVATFTDTTTATATATATGALPSATSTGTPTASATPTASPSVTFYVDSSKNGDCTSAAKACATIQQAIATASTTPAVIKILDGANSGSYYETTLTIGAGQDLEIMPDTNTSITIYASITVQQGAKVDLHADAGYEATVNGTDQGAIINYGTLSIENAVFIDGHPQRSGGAIFNKGMMSVQGIQIIHNNSGGPGGGIFNQGTLMIVDSTIDANQASGTGGGIYNSGTLTLASSSVSGNVADGNGGGIDNAGTLHMNGGSILINDTSAKGGGIANESTGTAVLTGTTIGDNDADQGGAGIDNAGLLTVLRSSLSGNVADGGNGGGLLEDGVSPLTLANSTVAGNLASSPSGNGGGIDSAGAAPITLLNVTLSANGAPNGAGGGINAEQSGALTITNTILSGNAAGRAMTADCAGTPAAGDYNLISLNDGCHHVTTDHDQYASPATNTGSSTRAIANFLSFYGGTTQTLQLSSGGTDASAIGHGNSAVCQETPIDGQDQRGFQRPQNSCDIGAYDTFGDRDTPTTFYVDQQKGTNDGTNASVPCTAPGVAACKTIDEALQFVGLSGTIYVAPGIYHDVIDVAAHTAPQPQYVSITGTGPGVVLDERHSPDGELIVDSSGTAAVTDLRIDAGTGYGITNNGVLTLAASQVTGDGTSTSGGGIFNNNGTLLVDTSAISHDAGGGIVSESGPVLLRDSQVTDNAAPSKGGGVYNNFGAVLISHSTISHNTAAHDGGGIWNAGTVRVRDGSLIAQNTAVEYGGGIDNSSYGAYLRMTDSALSGNSAGIGGGLYDDTGVVLINRSTISGNQAIPSGGSTQSDECTQAGYGGGICADETNPLSIVDSTIAGNSAADGGGIVVFAVKDKGMSLLNSTITANQAATGTGGIILDDSATSPLTWTNTIVLSNTVAQGAAGSADCSFPTSNSSPQPSIPAGDDNLFNLLANGGCQTTTDSKNQHTPAASSGLDPLGNYGGPTSTVRLQPGSPAIGAGDAPVCGASPVNSVDQRDLPRAPGSCDIGAYDTNGDLQSFTIPITSGWSLISLPLTPTTPLSASTVLAGVLQGGGHLAALFSLTNNRWFPSRIDNDSVQSGGDFPLQVGRGYLLYSDMAGSYTETGTMPAGAMNWTLTTGWNLVGVPHGAPSALLASMALDNMLAGSSSGHLAAIFGLTKSRWSQFRIDNGGVQSGVDFALVEGQGYLVYTDQGGATPQNTGRSAPLLPPRPAGVPGRR